MKHAAAVEDHRAVLLELACNQLCLDLARKYTRQIKSPEIRQEARLNYESIAKTLYCGRPKPPLAHPLAQAKKLKAIINRVTGDEARLDTDLAAVIQDPQFSLEQRKHAQQQREELEKEIERRHRTEIVEFVSSRRPSGYWESRANRWLIPKETVG